MDLTAISLDPGEIEEQRSRYAGLDDRASTAVRDALSALESGLMVVDLRTVFHKAMLDVGDAAERHTVRRGGLATAPDESRRIRTTPSLAIAPATRARRRVQLAVGGDGTLRFRCGLWRLRVPQDVFTAEGTRVVGRWTDRVPEIPPYVEAERQDLVLWEANWSPVPRLEFDPALLEHLYGWLFVVREVWDLTPVERGVLT